MSSNTWYNDSDEEEYEEENQEYNEEPLPEINKDFRDNVLKVKHTLYDNIVLEPELGTLNTHNKQVLQQYMDRLNKVYVMLLRAENGKIVSEKELTVFPEGSREAIRFTLDWVADFFNKNHISETIPYSDYIRSSFRDYQFVQDNSFKK